MPQKKVNGQVEDLFFLVFTSEDEVKIYLYRPKYFFCPPSHATLAPGLQRLQNSVAWLVTRMKKHAHISLSLKSLHWLPEDRRNSIQNFAFNFKCLQGQAPSYLTDLVQLSKPTRQLRNSSKLLYTSLLLKPKLRQTGGSQELQLTCGTPCPKNCKQKRA